MSDRDRGASFKVVTALAAAIIALLMTIGFFDSGRQYGEAIAKKSANSQTYSTNAEQEIRSTCLRLDGTAQAECIRRVVETANEHQRAEKDLVAQTEMALWAFWMLVVTTLMAAITAFGVFYVWRTLVATQEMVSDTKKMATDTREIGEAQVRAYIVPAGIRVCPEIVDGQHKSFLFQPIFKNTGQSPAIVTETRLKSFEISGGFNTVMGDMPPQNRHEVGAGAEFFGVGIKVSAARVRSVQEVRSSFHMSSVAEYHDIFHATTGKSYISHFDAIVPITNVILECTDRFGINVDFTYGAVKD